MKSDLQFLLENVQKSDLDDMKAKYREVVKMLFALLESVDECAARRNGTKILNMYRSLIGDR